MAVDLRLERKDNTPWGFRLTGGADVDVPLTVIKVKEGSLAEEAGLLVDDVIVKINGIPTTGLAHEEVHDLIVQAGNELLLVLHRAEDQDENLENDVVINKEVVLQNLRNLEMQNVDNDIEQSQEVPDEIIAEVISGHSELLPEQDVIGVNFNNVDLSNSKVLETVKAEQVRIPEKKWSTFLQKPKGPKPRPRSKEPELPKYPPYNPLKLPKKEIKTSTIPENFTSHESLQEEQNLEIQGDELLVHEGETVDSLSPIPSENTENLEIEEEFSQNVNENNYENEQREVERDHQKTVSFESSRSEDVKPTDVLTTSLEEQLAQVQKQLMSLSNLPSSIQSTIEEVTQQLARIASQANQASSYKADSSLGEQQEINYDEFSDRAESADEEELAFEHSDKESEDILEGVGKHFEDIEYEDGEQEGGSESEPFSPSQVSEEERTPKPREPTEEEKEEMRREQERIEKQQKETDQLNEAYQRRIEQRPTRGLAPLQRPIVLPGGRKWTQPDDAALASKPRRMTDEKIAETIETYSEVITGKLKGINFLKYTPPPKNLDYLQNSEVFRLLHEMDPQPRRGIAVRPEIIPAVQDIYEKRTVDREESTPVGMQR